MKLRGLNHCFNEKMLLYFDKTGAGMTEAQMVSSIVWLPQYSDYWGGGVKEGPKIEDNISSVIEMLTVMS